MHGRGIFCGKNSNPFGLGISIVAFCCPRQQNATIEMGLQALRRLQPAQRLQEYSYCFRRLKPPKAVWELGRGQVS
jgi:hypothetical protein